MNLFQAITIPLLILVALLVLISTSRRTLPWKTGLLWTLLWVTAALLIYVPAATAAIANTLGIGRGADLVFYAATLLGLAVSLYFYGRQRRIEEMLTGVIRREALRGVRRGQAFTDVSEDRTSGTR